MANLNIKVDVNVRIPGLEQLLEYAVSGIGAVGGPMLARWKARARSDALRIEAEGHADVMRITAQGQADAASLIKEALIKAKKEFNHESVSTHEEVSSRVEIESRLFFQEEKRERNITSVIRMAAENLRDSQVEEHSVDHDWVAEYFNHIPEVTSEHMQHIWAKILSGEVKAPGRTSLHTLAILKRMSQRDARLFETVAQFLFDGFVFHNYSYQLYGSGLFDQLDLEKIQGYPTMKEMLQLASYGLFSVSHGISKHYALDDRGCSIICQGNTRYKMSRNGGPFEFEVPGCILTPQGNELYNVIDAAIDVDYLRSVATFLHHTHEIKLESATTREELESPAASMNFKLVEPL